MPRVSFGWYFADMSSALDQGEENGQITPKKGRWSFSCSNHFQEIPASSLTLSIQEASENFYGMTPNDYTSEYFI